MEYRVPKDLSKMSDDDLKEYFAALYETGLLWEDGSDEDYAIYSKEYYRVLSEMVDRGFVERS